MPCKIKLKNVKKHFKSNLLLILTVVAVLLGVGFGILIKDRTHLSQIEKDYFAFPGEIFLRILKFLIFPLIASSLLSSIDGIQKSQNGNLKIVMKIGDKFPIIQVGQQSKLFYFIC